MENFIKEFINDPCVMDFKKYLMQEDFLQVTGNDRDEVSFTKFLEWLFDSNRNHELGVEPVRLFLKLLPKADYWSKVISCSAKEYSKSIDLILDCTLDDGSTQRVCIENKVCSDTQDGQLIKYYNKYKDENVIFCILAPHPDLLSHKHQAYHEVSYQNLMDNVLIPLKNNNDDILLTQIIHAMEFPSEKNHEPGCSSKKNYEPMAVSSPVAKQIEELMDEYGDLMINVLRMRTKKNSAEIQDLLSILNQQNTVASTGYYLYLPNSEGEDFNNDIIGPFPKVNPDMLKCVASLYIKRHNIVDETAFKDSDLFEVCAKSKKIFSLEALTESDSKNPLLEINDERYKAIDKKIYIYRQIRSDNTQDYINAIKSLGFKIIQKF